MKIKRLNWDSEFFGFNVYTIEADVFSEKLIKETAEKVFSAGADLIYLIIPNEIDRKYVYTENLIDQKVIFSKKLTGSAVRFPEIKPFRDDVIPVKLYDIALESGKYSRFKLDRRLPAESYEKMYKIWLERSVTGELADQVLVFRNNSDPDIHGMITLKVKTDCGEIGLLAADYSSQGKGIGSKLIAESENFIVSKNLNVMEVATQYANDNACRFYKKNGYTVKKTLNYYHLYKN